MSPEDLDKRAKELGVLSIETSAKAGHNVKTLFKKIALALPGGPEAPKEENTSESPSMQTGLIRNRRLDHGARTAPGVFLQLLNVV